MKIIDVAIKSTISVTSKTSFTYYSTSKVRGILNNIEVYQRIVIME